MDTFACLLFWLCAFVLVLLALELSRIGFVLLRALCMLLAKQPALLLAAYTLSLWWAAAQFQVTSGKAEDLDCCRKAEELHCCACSEFTLADTWHEFF